MTSLDRIRGFINNETFQKTPFIVVTETEVSCFPDSKQATWYQEELSRNKTASQLFELRIVATPIEWKSGK